jgi:S1-C subfamily serine protease
MDLAVVRIVDSLGNAITLRDRQPIEVAVSESFVFAQEIKVIGYPGMGGDTISQTSGEVSGFEEDYVKTDAKMGPGVSGGAAFSADTGVFLGVPTAGSSPAIGSSGEMEGDWLGLIRPVSYAHTLLAEAKRSSN